MSLPFIDLKPGYQVAKERIDAAIAAVLEHGQFIMGPEVTELESTLAAYTGTRHCISVASGTDSLEIALRALEIGPGDEVITVPFTWISTAEVISQVGATPRFVDIEEHSFNMDPALLPPLINGRTKAVIPVGLFGQAAAMEEINTIAEKAGIAVIEDAAQSFGATRHGVRSCALAPIASTSFFPAKPFGCYGDGGALFTSDDALAEKFRAIRNHGGIVRNHHTMVGMNGRFDTIQAAILLAKWPDFPREVELRSEAGARYSSLLSECCRTPIVEPENTHVYAQYTIRTEHRDELAVYLKEKGIPTGVYYPVGLHLQPVFSTLGYKPGDFPVTEKASAEVLSLPMHPYLAKETQEFIADALREFFSQR